MNTPEPKNEHPNPLDCKDPFCKICWKNITGIDHTTPEPISNIDEILSSDHTKGSHADDFSDREPCYCNRKQRIQHLITQEQIKELNKVPLDSAIDQCYIALAKYRDNRIAELEATLKENNNETN